MSSITPRRGSRSAQRILAAATAALVTTSLAVLPIGGQALAQVSPQIKVVDGRTQPVFSYGDAIRESVRVQTTIDSDADGQLDRVNVDIIRPRETERGLKVPVIIDESPYFDNLGRGNESERKAYEADGTPAKFPMHYDNYFVPRGYAVLLVDMVGTNKSDGCPDLGGQADVIGGVAVIDWLGGRVKGYRADGTEVKATWATGKAGMIGKSYDGTLPNAVAATGVRGLETIVPIAAISSWYKYTRMNGVLYNRNYAQYLTNVVDTDPDAKCQAVRDRLGVEQEDATGNHNAFWAQRDYIKDAAKVRASVFAVHGLGETNVKADHFSEWWKALARNGVPRKLWLSQYGHSDPFDYRREEWADTLHGWFDRWLYKIDNEIMREPRVDLQTGPSTWITQRDWPAPALPLPLWPNKDGKLGLMPAFSGSATITDNPNQTEGQMVSDPTVPKADRLAFVSTPLKKGIRLSGTPTVELRASVDQPQVNLTALLVDYGEDERVDWTRGGGLTTLPEESCVGESSTLDDACYRRQATITRRAPVEIIARGWIDITNRSSLTANTPAVPGQVYKVRWNTLPLDYTVKAGHRLALVLAASDRSYTSVDRYTPPPTVTVQFLGSRVNVPFAGLSAEVNTSGDAPAARSGDLQFTPEPGGVWRGPSDVEIPVPDVEFK
ncbi:Xaa-Pro dipeptidyl-peptidase [Rhizohabitans arisaemae]|uniref:Xaa-Pro dipeptidyl-peptidase n=1 Tax=Rhizohabitans arisaemae TaxID=2720610 RepID=UPI0024B08533|nr:Xaa-Pro dipeptidyl-peptidase [Rhizohabitans arisaemae]